MTEAPRVVRVSIPLPVKAAPVVARALEARRRAGTVAGRLRRVHTFPLAPPTWPGSIERPPPEPTLGADYDTSWARRPAARIGRALALEAVVRPAVRLVASPVITGLDRLDGVEGPVIFAANHSSHFDTPLLLTSLPERFRHRTVVAAAADYFFDRRLKATASALALAAIPIDRTNVSRRSLAMASELLEDGWNLVIFPEGGRSPDGWTQAFRAGAAFLATRVGVPVVPIHLEGSRRIIRKGQGGVRFGTTHVTFGKPIRPGSGAGDARAMSAEIERAVAALADEQASDWWTARRRAAGGATPELGGPQASPWRRTWALQEGRRGVSGPRWPA